MNFKIVSENPIPAVPAEIPVTDAVAPAGNINLDAGALKKAAVILSALNSKPRKPLIALLAENGRMNVSDIYKKLVWEQSVASIQLAILRRSKIVLAEREGRAVYYSLDSSRIAAISKAIQEFL